MTLAASATARIALRRKQLIDRAALVRGRCECHPGAGQQAKIDSVDNRLRLAHYDIAADLMDQIDASLDRHRRQLEEADMAAAGQAQDQLLAERGVETFETGSVRSRDGWQWLTSRKPARLSAQQIATGDQYAALYSAAHRDTLSTSANDNAGGDLSIQQLKDQAEARHVMRQKLAGVRAHLTAATGSERLANLLECVCGRGETLRGMAGGDERKAATYETELRIALDMAAVAFKMAPKREAAA